MFGSVSKNSPMACTSKQWIRRNNLLWKPFQHLKQIINFYQQINFHQGHHLLRTWIFYVFSDFQHKWAALNWLQSYLNGRECQIKIGDTTSSRVLSVCGVPRGSVLGDRFSVQLSSQYILRTCQESSPAMGCDHTSMPTTRRFMVTVMSTTLQSFPRWSRRALTMSTNGWNRVAYNSIQTNRKSFGLQPAVVVTSAHLRLYDWEMIGFRHLPQLETSVSSWTPTWPCTLMSAI